ncbi:MAG TPA: hypothetical protein VEK07_11725 [Polyangiaceae bacterium]|nr:hypothetical protein [Polyangiaceae bacterium]
MKGAIALLAAAAGASTFVVARPASALGPLDIEVGARVGGASGPIKDDPPTNILGLGVGGRAGLSVFGIYGGVSGMYYFGGSATESAVTPTGGGSSSFKLTTSSWLYGFDGGYSFKFLFLTLRPVVGVGNYTIHSTVSGQAIQDVHNLYVEPGLMVLLGIGLWFVGADADVFLTPGLTDSKAAFMANGQVGVKF